MGLLIGTKFPKWPDPSFLSGQNPRWNLVLRLGIEPRFPTYQIGVLTVERSQDNIGAGMEIHPRIIRH